MNKAKQRYDSKVKNTRILLNDWLALKQMSKVAGISMAEALHRLIEHQAQLPLMSRVATKPTFRVPPPVVALRSRPQPVLATNGHKGVAFRIKPKGVRNA